MPQKYCCSKEWCSEWKKGLRNTDLDILLHTVRRKLWIQCRSLKLPLFVRHLCGFISFSLNLTNLQPKKNIIGQLSLVVCVFLLYLGYVSKVSLHKGICQSVSILFVIYCIETKLAKIPNCNNFLYIISTNMKPSLFWLPQCLIKTYIHCRHKIFDPHSIPVCHRYWCFSEVFCSQS